MINYQIDKSRYDLKSPYTMKPRRIVFHNSGSDATAMAEIDYMERNNLELSFHDACDDTGAYNAIPHNRNAWHCGNYKNNLDHIGIEICYSRSGGERFKKAEEHGVRLCAELCKQFGMNPMVDIVEHRSMFNTNCPERSNINDIRVRVKRAMGIETPKPPTSGDNKIIRQYSEKGYGIPRCTVNVRNVPSTEGNTPVATYVKNETIEFYDTVVETERYYWLSYVSTSNVRRYIATYDKVNKERFVDCK